ncbi:hypothetical protein D8S78_20770 [Natrialba swarupiae]|nr:hypothetical protein [Natrialba swarupiae]
MKFEPGTAIHFISEESSQYEISSMIRATEDGVLGYGPRTIDVSRTRQPRQLSNSPLGHD